MAECGREDIYTPAEKQRILEKLKFTHKLEYFTTSRLQLRTAESAPYYSSLGGSSAWDGDGPSSTQAIPAPGKGISWRPCSPRFSTTRLLGYLYIRTPSCSVRKFNCTTHGPVKDNSLCEKASEYKECFSCRIHFFQALPWDVIVLFKL